MGHLAWDLYVDGDAGNPDSDEKVGPGTGQKARGSGDSTRLSFRAWEHLVFMDLERGNRGKQGQFHFLHQGQVSN